MDKIIYLVIGLVVGYVIARVQYNFAAKKSSPNQEDIQEKEKHMSTLLDYINTNGTVTNDRVETLLNVSDATAERYLDELEKEGAIVQVGRTGRSVTYKKA